MVACGNNRALVLNDRCPSPSPPFPPLLSSPDTQIPPRLRWVAWDDPCGVSLMGLRAAAAQAGGEGGRAQEFPEGAG